MVELVQAFITNGVISYNNGIEAVPETRESRDGATYINSAREGRPAFFSVAFKVESEFDLGGRKVRPYISIEVPVAKDSKSETVDAIEDEAMQHVVPMLRQIADSLETQIAALYGDTTPLEDAPEQP